MFGHLVRLRVLPPLPGEYSFAFYQTKFLTLALLSPHYSFVVNSGREIIAAKSYHFYLLVFKVRYFSLV